MGSTTYEWILDHEFAGKDPADWKWPYDIPGWVFTHRQLPVVPGAQIEFTSADIAAVHREMVSAAGDKNVWIVGGGDLAGQFADEGLLDEVIVMIAPVTLGAGAPLLPRRIELHLEELGQNGDFACARFAVSAEPDQSLLYCCQAPTRKGAYVGQFISIANGFATTSEGMNLASTNAQPGNPGACRRR